MSLFFAQRAMQKALFVGAFGVLTAAVIATFSRGGFLGLLSVLVYCFLVSPRKKLAMTVGTVLVVGMLSFAPSGFWTEMSTIVEDAENTESGTGALRREFWAIARAMFYANPIFGVGFKNFPWTVKLYESPDQVSRVGRSYGGVVAHSAYFTVLAELGLSGAVIFVAIVGYNFRDTRRVIRAGAMWGRKWWLPAGDSSWHATDPAIRRDLDKAACYARAIEASMLGYLVSGFFLSVFDYPHFWTMTAVIVALKTATTKALTGAGGPPADL
jgi:O-antigen ligase